MISIHELLELNGRKAILNPYLKLFSENGKSYAYMNRSPFRISFMEIGSGLKNILEQFDGKRTINDIIVRNSLDSSFFELLKSFYGNFIFRKENTPVKYKDPEMMTISIYPTNTCNLRCVYCYASAGEGPPVKVSVEKAEAWIDYHFANRPESIKKIRLLFHGGGEPTTVFTLMKKFLEMVKSRCEKENLDYTIDSITNGNFSNDVLNWFIREKANVYFSIDGTKEFHDRLRPYSDGRGSFEQAFSNIRKIKEAGLNTGIRCTVASTNKDEMKKMVDLVKENNLGFLHFGQFSEFGRSDKPDELAISNNEYRELFFESWKYALEKGVKMTGHPVISLQTGRDTFCSAYAKSGYGVTPEGFLTTCLEVTMSTDPASEIFFTGKIEDDNSIVLYQDKIERLQSRKTEDIPECRDCYLQYTCNAGCFIKSYRKTGKIRGINYEECDMMRNLSLDMLKHLLTHHEKIPGTQKPEYLKYPQSDSKDIFAEYVSFGPFG